MMLCCKGVHTPSYVVCARERFCCWQLLTHLWGWRRCRGTAGGVARGGKAWEGNNDAVLRGCRGRGQGVGEASWAWCRCWDGHRGCCWLGCRCLGQREVSKGCMQRAWDSLGLLAGKLLLSACQQGNLLVAPHWGRDSGPA